MPDLKQDPEADPKWPAKLDPEKIILDPQHRV